MHEDAAVVSASPVDSNTLCPNSPVAALFSSTMGHVSETHTELVAASSSHRSASRSLPSVATRSRSTNAPSLSSASVHSRASMSEQIFSA